MKRFRILWVTALSLVCGGSLVSAVRADAAPDVANVRAFSHSAGGPQAPSLLSPNMATWLRHQAVATRMQVLGRQQSNGRVPGTLPKPGEQEPRDLDLTFLQNPGAPANANAIVKSQLPPYTDQEPTYAPDARTIAFSSNRPLVNGTASTGFHLFTMFNDGSFQQPLQGTMGTDQEWPAYSPDGGRLTYSSRDGAGLAQIHVLSLQTGLDTQITSGAGNKTHPTWSHGDLIAFQSTETTQVNPTGLNKIWVVLFTGGPRYQVTGTGPADAANASTDDTEPAWEPSGVHVAFTRHTGAQERIWMISSISLTADPASPLSVNAVAQFTDFQTPLSAGGVPSQDQNATWRPEGPQFFDPLTDPNFDPNNSRDVGVLAFASTRKSSLDPTQIGIGAISVGTTFGIYRVTVLSQDATQLIILPESQGVPAGAAPAQSVAEDTERPNFRYDNIQPSWSPAAEIDKVTEFNLISNDISYASNDAFSYLNGSTPTTTPVQPLTIYDIWRSRPLDLTPPTLISLPVVTPRVQKAGSPVTISVQISDLGVGPGRVYAQLKNPNSFLQDRSLPPIRSYELTGVGNSGYVLDGHRIYLTSASTPDDDREGSYQEIGYQPINPQTYSYTDGGTENVPFDLSARDIVLGADTTIAPVDTLELQRTPLPTDPPGVVTYSTTWITDVHPTDYYLDIIAQDLIGNTIDYDNVWGFTTQPFSSIGNQTNHILLVNDYMTPQLFLFGRGSVVFGLRFGAESAFTDNPAGKNSVLDPGYFPLTIAQPNFVLDAVGRLDEHALDTSPPSDLETFTLIGPVANTLGPGSNISDFEHAQQNRYGPWTVGPRPLFPLYDSPPALGLPIQGLVNEDPNVSVSPTVFTGGPDLTANLDGYDIWRILCRGPVPPTTLAAYGPSSINQPSLTDVNKTVRKPVYKSCVVWGSPFTNDEYVGPGTILDVSTQQMLANFVHPGNGQPGGHLFLTGQDIGFALGPTAASAQFLAQTFGVQFSADFTLATTRAAQAGPIGKRFNPQLTPLKIELAPLSGPFIVNNLPFYVPGTAVDADQSNPDVMTVLANAMTDYDTGAASTFSPFTTTTTGTTITTSGDGSKTVYMPFGIEGVDEEVVQVGAPQIIFPAPIGTITFPLDSPRNTRSALMHGIVCWMRDYSISGVVNELLPDNTTIPAANALVAVTLGNQDFSTVTDLQGNYQIDGLPTGGSLLRTVNYVGNPGFPVFERPAEGAGNVTIFSSLPGFALEHAGTFGVGHGDQTILGSTILLNKLEPGTVTGKVTDSATGKPLAGVTVTLVNVPFTNVTQTTTTDANGNYTFTNVPATPPAGTMGISASSYVLTFSATGYNTVVLGVAPNSANNVAIPVLSQQTTVINAALVIQGGSITGTVTDGTNPFPNATVTATPTTLTTKPIVVTANAQGIFTFQNLNPDVYILVATAPGRMAGTPVRETVAAAATITGVILTIGPTTTVTTPPPGTVVNTDSISGMVTISSGTTTQPVVNGQVQLLNSAGATVMATTNTSSTGAYSFTALADGTYQVNVSSANQAQAAPVTVTLNSAINNGAATGINFTLAPLFTFPEGISMLSIPYTYSAGAGDAASLFGTQFIAEYQPLPINNYLFYPNLPGDAGRQVQPGRGYWVQSASPTLFLTPGSPVASPFNLLVAPGWNQIGDPFTSAVDTSLIQVIVPFAVGNNPANQPLRLQDALTAGIIRTPIFGYSQANNAYFPTSTLAPFLGYWLYVDPTGSKNQPVTLVFTNTSPGAARGATR